MIRRASSQQDDSRFGEEVVVDDYPTDRFNDEAVGFVERHAGSPFFLFLSHKTPHTPLHATAKYADRHRHIEDAATRVYAAIRWKLIRYNRTDYRAENLDGTGRPTPPQEGWPDSPLGQINWLYDLANDPAETVNYAPGRPDIVRRLNGGVGGMERGKRRAAHRVGVPVDRGRIPRRGRSTRILTMPGSGGHLNRSG